MEQRLEAMLNINESKKTYCSAGTHLVKMSSVVSARNVVNSRASFGGKREVQDQSATD